VNCICAIQFCLSFCSVCTFLSCLLGNVDRLLELGFSQASCLVLTLSVADAGDREMTELKQRLMETETQMLHILEAMEVVQQKVGAVTADTADLVVCLS